MITAVGAVLTVALGLFLPQSQQVSDPNAPAPGAPKRLLGFKVFKDVDRPVTGTWDLEIPDAAVRRIEIREPSPGEISGVDEVSKDQLIALKARKQGIGYEGQLLKVFDSCGLGPLPVLDFLPLGDAVVLKFETVPPNVPCPPIDGGHAGRLLATSHKGGPVRLRDFSEISSASVRDAYSIGGDRPNSSASYSAQLGSVSLEEGTEVKMIGQVKAPLDGTYWFQVEAAIATEAGVAPPRGYLNAESLRFVGSLTLRRVPPAAAH